MDVNADFMAVLPRRRALRFIVLLGIVCLFADMTSESARDITSPYLALLGASATIVGLVCGFGELSDYALRLVSGYFPDRTGRYWPITIFSYVLDLLAVPALALTGRWELTALLIIAERMGKAIRAAWLGSPAARCSGFSTTGHPHRRSRWCRPACSWRPFPCSSCSSTGARFE